MRIKSFILALTLLGMSVITFAQKGELTTAVENYDKYAALKGNNLALPSLTAAKESIDKVTVHPKTMNDPQTWAYRGLIYSELALLEKDRTKSQPLVDEAVKSIKKTSELDAKGEQKTNVQKAERLLFNYTLNKGVDEYKAQKYTDAYNSFNTAAELIKGDTTATYFAGISAMNANDNVHAIEKYSSLLKTNYSLLEDVYANLSVLYAKQKDTVSAIRIAAEGAQKFPKNTSLAQREIEFSLMTGKQKEVIDKISAQSQKEPNNKIFPYYLGIAYSSLKEDAKAEDAYKKAIAIDPAYAEANINLGGLIMNNGIEIFNKANKLPTNQQKEYTAQIKLANAEFDRAYPYLSKAVEVDPKSRLALQNLKTYYLIKKNQAKVDELQKQLDALK